MFVLDCSITMSWLFEDEISEYSEQILDRLAESDQAMVPSLWILEVTNVLLSAERRKRITPAQSLNFWELLHSLPIDIYSQYIMHSGESILNLGRTHQLSAYDATYLDLAFRLNIPLATLDKQLLRAAEDLEIGLI